MHHLHQPRLRFSPYAWAKLIFLRDYGPTEVGMFGITPDDDPMLVTDVRLLKQECTSVTVAFDDESVSEFFEDCVDEGLQPQQFARIWIHTHPGRSATPSNVDEETFQRVFGPCDWAVMAILARGGETYARTWHAAGAGVEAETEMVVDYSVPFEASDSDQWEYDYLGKVTKKTYIVAPKKGKSPLSPSISTKTHEMTAEEAAFQREWEEYVENEEKLHKKYNGYYYGEEQDFAQHYNSYAWGNND